MGRTLWAPRQGTFQNQRARGVWLSPAWLSLRGNLSAQAPGSGQELDSRDCLPQLDATQWGVWGGRWDFVRGGGVWRLRRRH